MEKKVFINIEDSHSGHDDSYSSQTSTQDGGLVTMTRNGAYTTQMVMERGRRHVCHYATPFGDMLLGIFAKKVESSVTEDGGELLLNYTIDVNADLAASNELKITVSGQ